MMLLLKNAKNRIYYYKINVYQTLFGDYLIQKEYGACSNMKPTNTIKQYASTKREALYCVLDIAVSKKSLGYKKAS